MRAWLERHRRVQLHFTPTSGSWLNLVEAFSAIIIRQALRRGNFPAVADLMAASERFVTAWNHRCGRSPRLRSPTKDPDTVRAQAIDPRRRKTPTTSASEHQRDSRTHVRMVLARVGVQSASRRGLEPRREQLAHLGGTSLSWVVRASAGSSGDDRCLLPSEIVEP